MSPMPPSARLDRNELPFGPDVALLDGLGDVLRQVNRYPSGMWQARLIERIAARNGCRPEEILLGAGSAQLLGLIWQSALTRGAKVAYAAPGFDMYPMYTRQLRGVPVEVALTPDFGTDLDRLADVARIERPALIAVTNPHNPSGVRDRHVDIANFVARTPPETLVVLDEAYHEFDERSSPIASVELATSASNVVLTRTFSKAYGLAGLRIGYAIASRQLISRISTFSVPFAVSDLACAAAIHQLGDTEGHIARITEIRTERSRLTTGLRALGFDIIDSATNFVLLPGQLDIAEYLRELGISVTVSPIGARLSVGSRDANDTVLDAARTYIRQFGVVHQPN